MKKEIVLFSLLASAVSPLAGAKPVSIPDKAKISQSKNFDVKSLLQDSKVTKDVVQRAGEWTETR